MASERIVAKRAALRERIVEVALRDFAAQGFETTTMTGIADRLQMTGPALYYYFSTKEELLFACLDQVLDKLLSDLRDAAKGQGSPAGRMTDAVKRQVVMELGEGSAASLINAHLYGPQYLKRMFSAEQQEALRLKQRALLQVYRGLIEDGIADKVFAPCDATIAAFNVLALVQYSGVWHRPGAGRKPVDVPQVQAQAVLRMLCADDAPPQSDNPVPARRQAKPAATTSRARKPQRKPAWASES